MSVGRNNVYTHIPLSDVPRSVNAALQVISDVQQRQDLSPSFPTYSQEPARLYDGLTVYADGVNWNPGEGAGLYIYHSGTWFLLSSSPGADAKYVAAGYGSIRQETSTGITIGTGWTTIPFSTAVVATPKNVEQDTANNSLHPLAEGIVILKAGIVLNHNESNQGRVLNFRIHDLDDNVSTGLVPYAVARNQPGSNVAIQVMGTINADRVGDNYVVQVQAGDGTFSGVTVEYANFMMYYVSEDVLGGGVGGGTSGIQSGLSYVPTIAPANGYQLKNVYVDDTGTTPVLAFEYDDTTQGDNTVPYLIQSDPPPGQYFQVENLYVDSLGRLAFTFDDGT